MRAQTVHPTGNVDNVSVANRSARANLLATCGPGILLPLLELLIALSFVAYHETWLDGLDNRFSPLTLNYCIAGFLLLGIITAPFRIAILLILWDRPLILRTLVAALMILAVTIVTELDGFELFAFPAEFWLLSPFLILSAGIPITIYRWLAKSSINNVNSKSHIPQTSIFSFLFFAAFVSLSIAPILNAFAYSDSLSMQGNTEWAFAPIWTVLAWAAYSLPFASILWWPSRWILLPRLNWIRAFLFAIGWISLGVVIPMAIYAFGGRAPFFFLGWKWVVSVCTCFLAGTLFFTSLPAIVFRAYGFRLAEIKNTETVGWKSFAVLVVPPVGFVIWQASQYVPAAPPTISRETTYLTEPVLPSGYIDYETALAQIHQQHGGQYNSATGDNVRDGNGHDNSQASQLAKTILQIFGPKDGVDFKKLWKQACAKPAPLPSGPFFERFDDNHRFREKGIEHARWEYLERIVSAPWSATDFPKAAKWIQANQSVIDSTNFEIEPDGIDFRFQTDSKSGQLGTILGTEYFVELRDFVQLLPAYAMHLLEQGKIEECHSVLIAARRFGLAFQFNGRSNGYYSSANIIQSVSRAERRLLASGTMNRIQLLRYQRLLEKLPKGFFDPAAMVTELRLQTLSRIQQAHQERIDVFYQMKNTTLSFDIDKVMRDVNSKVDSSRALLDFEGRITPDQFISWEQQTILATPPIQSVVFRPFTGSRQYTNKVSKAFCDSIEVSMRIWNNLRARQMADSRLAKLAIALELYRIENGMYPGRLSELLAVENPGIDTLDLHDPFSQFKMVYRFYPNGFDLYSVGPNLRDDGGLESSPRGGSTNDISILRRP